MLSLHFLGLRRKTVELNDHSNYAAVAADTFSSELGILSNSKPRLITSLSLRVVPPGTNGGVTATGLLAGVFGAFTVAITSAVLLPFDLSGKHMGGGGGLYVKERVIWTLAMTVWGALGSVLDSVLGSLVQASVVDKTTGKVVEGSGGRKVLTSILHTSICLVQTELSKNTTGPHPPLLLSTRQNNRSLFERIPRHLSPRKRPPPPDRSRRQCSCAGEKPHDAPHAGAGESACGEWT